MSARLLVWATALGLALTACGDARSPSVEVFCMDTETLFHVSRGADAITEQGGEPSRNASAQLSAAWEAAIRHAPEPIYEDALAAEQSWQQALTVLDEHEHRLDDLSADSRRTVAGHLRDMAATLSGPIRDWADRNC